jgi:lysophospholipase L1-like esterase
MLGTNDVKEKFELIPGQIAHNMDVYILSYLIQMNIPVVLISPPPIVEWILSNFWPGTNEKVTELSHIYVSLAAKYETVSYIDLQSQLAVGADGVHLTAQSHALIAEAVAKYASNFFTK